MLLKNKDRGGPAPDSWRTSSGLGMESFLLSRMIAEAHCKTSIARNAVRCMATPESAANDGRTVHDTKRQRVGWALHVSLGDVDATVDQILGPI